MDEDEANGKEIAAANKVVEDAEKQKVIDEKIKKEAAENVLWPDGLAHRSDGTKVFTPDNQVVSGVNLYSQKHAEPPAEPAAKGELNVESMKEGEERKSDIADAASAFPKAAKKAAEAAAEQQETNEEAWKTLSVNEHDGLQHWPDGQKYYAPDS